ncbi:MAG: IclR family transcriptional regulator [Provencibacterium sp.]|jgi:IclR family KDG regulon transcriptional repressor|nr:IclR family transcriptional regulator [Provencibacterium sp.]
MEQPHKGTLRVLGALEAVAAAPDGLTLGALSQALSSPKSTLSPILHTLCSERWLVLRDGRYRLGERAFETGQRYLDGFDILEAVRETMHSLVDVGGETCHFGVLSGGDVLYLHKEDSPEPIRMFSSIGRRLPAYSTGIGKALLCDCNLPALRRLYPDGLRPLTAYTVTDFEELAAQLAKARAEGAAYESEESNLHIRCVAVPLRRGGRIAAALSIAIPTFRCTEEKLALSRTLLFGARDKLERLLAGAAFRLA